MAKRKDGALGEAERLLEHWRNEGGTPDLWFCYHPYDKSPDWLGMEICTRLGLPMVTAEPCKTGQGPNGEWLPWRAEAQKGIAMADVNIVLTEADHDYLAGFVAEERIVRINPFIDADLLEVRPVGGDPWPARPGVRLLTVGMMRPGAKLQSYEVLAGALAKLRGLDWSAAIVGGGPGEPQVRELFSWDDENRIAFLGERDPGEVLGLMERADILAWPGCREAYGMVYLEAATRGTPAVALDNMGVPLVVANGRSGLLANPANTDGYADALAKLIQDSELRGKLGEGARTFALVERSAAQAATRLKAIIDGVFRQREKAA
jgi:glycosyltransferase involved in cell wall biosynthesis